MSVKLIAIDIDGTLLNSNHEITPRVKAVLQKKAAEGVKIVLCTGRPLVGAQAYIKELGLDTEHDYSISYNGSLVQNNATGKIIAKHTLGYDDFVEAEFLARKLGVHFHVQDSERMFTCNRDISPYTVVEAFLTKIPLEYRTVDEVKKDEVISKMMFIDHEEVLDAAIEKLPSVFTDRFNTVKSSPFYLEILNKDASKGNAVRDLATFLNISKEEIMTIGDNDNDISMLEYADVSVAMGNATERTRAAAKYLSKTNDEDGVAYAVETWA